MSSRQTVRFDWLFDVWCFNANFNNISAIPWRPVLVLEEAAVPGKKTPTMGKQLVSFITCGCESSVPFLWSTKPGLNPRRIGDRLVWVVRSNDLTHWAIRALYKLIKSTNLLMQNKQRRDENIRGKETYYIVDTRVGNSYYKPISTV